eukprot:scaffold394677_cov14-Prasinocladus_malaysianus.AAC.1
MKRVACLIGCRGVETPWRPPRGSFLYGQAAWGQGGRPPRCGTSQSTGIWPESGWDLQRRHGQTS